jgi:hypothetical protein
MGRRSGRRNHVAQLRFEETPRAMYMKFNHDMLADCHGTLDSPRQAHAQTRGTLTRDMRLKAHIKSSQNHHLSNMQRLQRISEGHAFGQQVACVLSSYLDGS